MATCSESAFFRGDIALYFACLCGQLPNEDEDRAILVVVSKRGPNWAEADDKATIVMEKTTLATVIIEPAIVAACRGRMYCHGGQ